MYRRRRRTPHHFVHLEDRAGTGGREQKIPLVVYQTWEDRFIDDEHYEGIQKFRDLNPEVEFTLFVAEEREEYMNTQWADHPVTDVFNRALFPQIQTDIFRYCLIFERGGYYVDINKAILANIPSLHSPDDSALLSADMWETHIYPRPGFFTALPFSHKMVTQWAFGFSPRHPLLDNLIQRIVELSEIFDGRVVRSARDVGWALAGPGAFSDVVREYLEKNGLEGITMTDEFFDGLGVTRIRGSHRKSVKHPYYGDGQNCLVLAPRDSSVDRGP